MTQMKIRPIASTEIGLSLLLLFGSRCALSAGEPCHAVKSIGDTLPEDQVKGSSDHEHGQTMALIVKRQVLLNRRNSIIPITPRACMA